jgi:hypothetical protein
MGPPANSNSHRRGAELYERLRPSGVKITPASLSHDADNVAAWGWEIPDAAARLGMTVWVPDLSYKLKTVYIT